MNIERASAGIRRLYVDSSPLIYYVERNTRYLSKMRRFINLIDTASFAAISSTLTLAEVLVGPYKSGDDERLSAYLEILEQSDHYRLRPVTSKIVRSAAELRARYNLRTPDAAHIATVKDSSCDALLTNDLRLKRILELPVLVLDELEL